jgi:hypothetical protein
VGISRDLIRSVRALDEYDLRRLMIFVRGLLLHSEGPAFEVRQHKREPVVTYRQQMVRCGKDGCTRCPHGPYWYAYWREDGRLKSRYIGKQLPQKAKG